MWRCIIESKLIATAIASREGWEIVSPLISERRLSDMARIVYDELTRQYNTSNTLGSADIEIIQESLSSRYPKSSNDLGKYLSSLPSPSSLRLLHTLAVSVERRGIGHEIIQALTREDEERVVRLADQYTSLASETQETAGYSGQLPSEFFRRGNGCTVAPLPSQTQ